MCGVDFGSLLVGCIVGFFLFLGYGLWLCYGNSMSEWRVYIVSRVKGCGF